MHAPPLVGGFIVRDTGQCYYGAMVTIEAIKQARARLDSLARRTPLLYSDSVTHRVGSPVYLKAENLQRTGSFKLRGALNKLALLPGGQEHPGVIAASAGNHAQGVALAAAHLNIPATVVMPETASLAKYEATLGYGATVIRHGTSFEEARVHAESLAQERGLCFVPAFDDEAIIAGQGTIGLEILEDLPATELVIVPVGGGGLLAGIATAIKALKPQATVVGVQAAAAPAAARSYRAGRRLTVAPGPTIADGIAICQPGRIPLAIMRREVDDMVTVDEEAISYAMLLLLERSKLLVEAAGAVGIAALLSGAVQPHGKPTVAVLSGGNLDVVLLERLVEHGLTLAGRHLAIRVTVPDQPGQLARLLTYLAELKVNVMEVEHHRSGYPLPVGDVEVYLTLEVQNQAHGDEVREKLRAEGYREERVLLRHRTGMARPAHDIPGAH